MIDFSQLIQVSEDDWPHDEYKSVLASQISLFPTPLRRLYENKEYPYLHDCELREIVYQNPDNQICVHPSIVITLKTYEEEIKLIFPHIFIYQTWMEKDLQDYSYQMEGVQKAWTMIREGRIHFLCKFSYGMTLYIQSAGIDVQSIENEM